MQAINSSASKHFSVYGILLIQQFIAASTHFIAKFANKGADPFTIVFARGICTLIVFAVWFILRKRTLPTFERSDVRLLLLLGALNIPCNQVLFVAGLQYTSPPNASLAYALVPAFVLSIMVVFYGESAPRIKIVGIVLALVGTVFILFERDLDVRSEFFWGNVMELCAACSWAWYSILGKRLALKYGALYATGLTMASGMLWFAPLYLILPFFSSSITPLGEVDALTIGYAAYLGVMVSVVGYFLWYFALTRLPASNVAVFSNLQSVIVTLFAVFLFSMPLSVVFIIGGACVITGVIITQQR